MDIAPNYTVVQMLHPHDDSHAYQFCPRCGGPLERRVLKAATLRVLSLQRLQEPARIEVPCHTRAHR